MLSLAWLCGGILALAPSSPVNEPAPDRPAYEAARALAGRDGGAHVRLALWCEAHGMPAERLKHLAMAVLINPDDAAARAMLGLVAHDGRWSRPADVGRKVREDAKLSATLAEYNRRRATAPETADSHWRLALWCEEAGLPAEATAHLATVVRLEPGRDAAWKRLGCKKVGGRWMTDAQVEAQKTEVAAQKEANDRWRPSLAKWRGMLGDSNKRAEAEAALASVNDARSVPAILAVFGRENAADQVRMVLLLGQVDARASSRALALLSVFGGTDTVRRSATETLKNRDVREFADVLIAMLRDPIKYEIRPVGGPGSPGALFVEGQRFNVRRFYAAPSVNLTDLPAGSPGFDLDGLPAIYRSTVTSVDGRKSAPQPAGGRITADRLMDMIGNGQLPGPGPILPDPNQATRDLLAQISPGIQLPASPQWTGASQRNLTEKLKQD